MRHKSGGFNKANPMPGKAYGARRRAEAPGSSGRTKGRGGEGRGRAGGTGGRRIAHGY
jgi:hypothetical protein